MSTIAVINYGMGNLRSVAQALQTVGAKGRVCTKPEEVGDADGLMLPGVGALADCIAGLERSGFADFVREWIVADRPFFGICLGLQALFDHSEESDTPGLGIFPGRVVRFKLPTEFKVPHMGWNTVDFRSAESPLLNSVSPTGESFYFVHSYYVAPDDPDLVFGTTDYGGNFCAAINRGRCFATQFHPEKSQQRGLQLYRNFAAVAGKTRSASA